MKFNNIKSLDKIFVYVLGIFLVGVLVVSVFLVSYLDNYFSLRIKNETLNTASILTNTVRQEMSVGNFRSAWQLINQNVSTSYLIGFLILDEKNNLLINDSQFEMEFSRISSKYNFDVFFESKDQILKRSNDLSYFQVENSINNIGNGDLNYKIRYLFFDNSIIKIRETLVLIVIVLIFCLLTIGLIGFLTVRKLYFKAIEQIGNGVESLIFEKNVSLQSQALISEYFPAGALIQKFSLELKTVKSKLKDQVRLSTMEQVTQQVSHDIRSPLSALNVIVNQLGNIPEDKRLILRSSVQRINDIANDLLQKGKNNVEALPTKASSVTNQTIEHIPALIDILISEKRTQFRNKININIEANIIEGYLAFAKIYLREFKRVISNLINNSVEALVDQKGQIELIVKKAQNKSIVIIKDNGKGIPANILARLGEKGLSSGKENNNENNSGSGLGIYHAKKTMESFGAEFNVSSIEGQGTTITLSFPEVPIPSWFVSQLDLSKIEDIIILDDDSSIHQIWKGRFDSLKINKKIHHFSGPLEFRKFVSSEAGLNLSKMLFLMDYELLGYQETGLDLIESLKLLNVCLVTSRYEETNIRERCENLGVKLIPKGLAAYVPVVNGNKDLTTQTSQEVFDCVLIDDDALIRLTWEMSAKTNKKKIKTYADVESFRRDINMISRDTKIYIDSSLGNNVKGEDEAKILLKKDGFKSIYLATGYNVDHFSEMPWINGIVGKEPPF